jgi:SAM-dependent methyltransferase
MNDAAHEYQWKGRTGPFSLLVAPGVFTPSRTSMVLADALEIRRGDTVLDVGCGTGVLSFVAARLGAARAVGCDVSEAAVRCAHANARSLGLAEVTEFRAGNLLEPAGDCPPDVVIADVSGVPDALARATGWFPDGRGGGPTGTEVPIAMLAQIGGLLARAGRVYLPTGTIQAETRVLAAARGVFGNAMAPVASRDFPLPQAVTQDPQVARLIDDGVLPLQRKGSRFTWRLTIWRCGPG